MAELRSETIKKYYLTLSEDEVKVLGKVLRGMDLTHQEVRVSEDLLVSFTLHNEEV